MKYLFLLVIFISGCASVTSVDPDSVKIGTDENDFVKIHGSQGQKLYYSDSNQNNFLWLIDLGKERIWLTGNPAFGGTTTQRHHTMIVDFDKGNISDVSTSHMDGINKNRLPASRYKQMYWLMESLNACKSYLSIGDRGKYEYTVRETINSWIHAPEVFEKLRKHDHGFLYSWTESKCNDAFVVIERVYFDIERGTANLGG